MKTKAIIFDKDGTLLSFDAFWLAVSDKAIDAIFSSLGVCGIPKSEVLEAFGVCDGVTAIRGVLCCGTYTQMGEAIAGVLAAHEIERSRDEVIRATIDAYHDNYSAGIVKADCEDIAGVLRSLSKLGLTLAVVTSDDPFVTKKCLDDLGISEFFSYVFTDDGVHPHKPDPFYIKELCRLEGIAPEEIVMVGDTLTDMKFAENGGARAIAIAKNEENTAILAPTAAAVVYDISEVINIID